LYPIFVLFFRRGFTRALQTETLAQGVPLIGSEL